ncbi:DUF6493 family protein [uncultured Friedmanniella sp.]|uniref:DUF6493 family protein n=1 Tax=uncultured Friedmanniella sp. TaxID=335381 RepID=UPI0035CB677A
MTGAELEWSSLAALPPALVGGLVVEYGERARTSTEDESWRRGSSTIRAVGDALAAAATGATPAQPTLAMPGWFGDVVIAQLRAPRAVLVRSAQSIRALERLGLIQLEHSTDYALAMLHLSDDWVRSGDVTEDLLVQVERDPALVDRIVHRLAADECERGISPQDDRPFRGSWQQPLAAAVVSDERARGLAVAACLGGLAGEPTADLTAWYVAMLDALAVTTEELAVHQPAVRRLLTTASPTVVTYGVRRLLQLDRAQLLDDDATATALQPAVTIRSRTTARLAVRLLAAIADRSPTSEVVAAAMAALGHIDAEVQRQAGRVLLARGPDGIPAGEFAALEPSVQHELSALLEQAAVRPAVRPTSSLHHHHKPSRTRTRTPSDLAAVPPAVLGGLLVEHGERARSRIFEERWEKDAALSWAVADAVRDALDDKEPHTPTTRMPTWLAPALRHRLADLEFFTRKNFFDVRVVERAGLVDLEHDDQYVTAMIWGLAASWTHESRAVGQPEQWFAGDPELLDRTFWRIFEVPGNGSISLFQTDQYSSGAWQRAVLVMIEDGRIDRERVVDAALSALGGEWPGYRLQWFGHLLEALEISVAELAARQPALRRLLRSTESAAITPALRWLALLGRAGLLDDRETAAELGPVMTARTKTHALNGLAVLKAIHQRTPDAEVVVRAREALAHPHADVQRAAAALLSRAGADQQLTAAAGVLDAVVRRELGLGGPSAGPAAPPATGLELPSLLPVTTTDLLERLAALMEDASDPLELELVLDQLARTDNPALLTPLLKRASAIVDRGHGGDWQGDTWLGGQVARLVTVACGQPLPVSRPKGPVLAFLVDRLGEVEQILERRAGPGPLVATPDVAAGWVSAEALVRRLRAGSPHRRPADLVAGFLRLHPESRREALADADLPGELGQALRHALGDDQATTADVKDVDLWVAASRARAPLADDPVLIGAGLYEAGEGIGLDFAVTALRHREVRGVLGMVTWDEESWETEVVLAHASRRSRGDRVRRPTALPAHRLGELEHVDAAWHAWAATVWPHDAEHFSDHALQPMLGSAQWSVGSGDAAHVLRALGRHPGRFGPLAASVLALGLTAGRLEDRVLAADVFLHLLGGALPAPQLADAMSAMAGPSKATRWAESLRNAASGGGGTAVVEVLTHLVPQLPSSHHGLYALLDLLHQEQLRLGGPVDDPALRTWLAELRGSSRSARSARALLAL